MSSAACNCTTLMLFPGLPGLCGSVELWVLFGVTALLLLASLLGFGVFCYRRCKTNHGGSFPSHIRTSVKSVAETPVYGNLSFIQSVEELLKGEKAADPEASRQRLPELQMCYANLKETTPAEIQEATDSGIQYADMVIVSKGKPNSETQEKDAGKQKSVATGAVMQGDPLYATVQTNRYRTLFEDEGYANNS